ncbi:MAG: 23S rRNA pseudouridine(1911/1915/1917) synthase RluD [Gammaproteobacteria bacterium]|nr:23S rRNA pseudouridine(1911/1915/1917) synthase RluD [Gammaproteobacteria bacterium]
MQQEEFTVIVPEQHAGKRLDQVLALMCPRHSRSRLQAWIRNGFVTVDGAGLKQRDTVHGGQSIKVSATLDDHNDNWIEQEIPIDVVFEDDAILAVNKMPGIVVHPGAGNPDRTLVNALLYYAPQLAKVPRAGIVQRLDKDTSGIMVVAKTPESHTRLVRDLQDRNITREYRAIVRGTLISGGTVSAPIGRHPTLRTRMAVTEKGKPATTHYRVLRKYPACTDTRVRLETGRTHQIRVHMAHLGHPVIGDPVYGGRKRYAKNVSAALREALAAFPRQALHALRLELRHPVTGESLELEAPLAADMAELLDRLSHD